MKVKSKKRICIICEGYEEFEYLEAIINLNVWSNYIIDLKNAESNGSIFSLYQFYFQNDDYDLVLIMADTDRPQYNDFKLLIKKINDFHGIESFAKDIIIFGNPCTMQFILNHFSFKLINVMYSNKKRNAKLIESLTGVQNYDAHMVQRKRIFQQIDIENYCQMKKNISYCKQDFQEVSSTNFLDFVLKLESDNFDWIDEINNKLN